MTIPPKPDIGIASAVFTILQQQLYRPSTSAADRYISQVSDMLTLQREGSPNLSYQTHMSNISIGGASISGNLDSAATKQDVYLIFSCRH